MQEQQPVANGLLVRRLDEGEIVDVAQAQGDHLQHHGGQIGAQDLRVGELGAGFEVVLRVQADGHAVGDTAGAAGALVCGGLGDLLNGQALDLGARGVTRDTRQAGVHHVVDARHGQRGFRDVGGQHDAPAGVRGKDPVLLRVGQAAEQGHDLYAAPVLFFNGLHAVADVALGGEEAQDVAFALAHELLASVDHTVDHVGVDFLDGAVFALHLLHQRAVADLHGVSAAGDLDDGGGVALGVCEMLRKRFRVDGCGGDNHLQVRALRQQPLEVSEQKVDIQRALVRLVDDDRVVGV